MEYRIAVKFEGAGAKVTFTEIDSQHTPEGADIKNTKKYGQTFKTRAATAQAVDLQFRRFLKDLGAPPVEQLELSGDKKKSGKKKAKLAAVPAPEKAEEKKKEG